MDDVVVDEVQCGTGERSAGDTDEDGDEEPEWWNRVRREVVARKNSWKKSSATNRARRQRRVGIVLTSRTKYSDECEKT